MELRAHKIVLASHSEVLEQKSTRTQHQHLHSEETRRSGEFCSSSVTTSE